jgi:hypothetical protein
MKRYTYRFLDRPPFLQGCFFWKGRGYHYAGPVPDEVQDLSALTSDDPWLVLASAIEGAKRGDYTGIPKLRRWARDESVDPTLSSACLGLMADAGLEADLEFLAELMLEGPNSLRIESCLAAEWTGVLWLLPFMLEAWHALDRRADRHSVEANISNLLEPLEGEPVLFGGNYSETEYVQAVTARLAALKAVTGTDDVSVLGGEPVDMNKQIWTMRKALVNSDSETWVDWGSFLLWRRKFEVYTGVNCSSFYGKKGEFLPLNAAAVLNRHMAASPPINFKIGERYFFGRRIPRQQPSQP